MWNKLDTYINKSVESRNFGRTIEKELANDREEDAVRQLRKTVNESEPPNSTVYPINMGGKNPSISDKTFALNALVAGIQSSNPDKRFSSLKKLSDWCKSEEFAKSAIYGTDIVNKTFTLLQRFRRNNTAQKYEEMMLFHLFESLSTYKKCAELMAMNRRFVSEMYKIIYNIQTEKQHTAAKILSNITGLAEKNARIFLRRNNPYTEILKVFNRASCTVYLPTDLWLHLSHLLKIAPTRAVSMGFFDVFFHRIVYKMPKYHLENMKCFALLLKSKDGREAFTKSEAPRVFFNLISMRSATLDNYEYTLEALNEALISEFALERCMELEDLPKAIVNLAKTQDSIKIYSLCYQIIRKLYRVPGLHPEIYKNCLPMLKKFRNKSDTNVEHGRLELISYLVRNKNF